MSSFVEIANSALDLVGQQQIMTLDDQTAAARKANLHIYDSIREVLGVGRWTSAKKQSVLSQLADAPEFGWAYQYQLPGDYIRTISFNDDDPLDVELETWEIQGRVLLTDETEANLVYVCDLTASGNDINAASQPLTECFKLKLACKLAWLFQQSATRQEQLLEMYIRQERRALAADAREGRRPLVNSLSQSNWIRNRSASTNG